MKLLKHLINEMAKPVKICDKCGNQMSKFHYWYKGEWRCKKSATDKSTNVSTKQPTTATSKEQKFKRPADVWKHMFKHSPETVEYIRKADEAAKRRERKEKKLSPESNED